jgi:hypothetical protein
MMTDQSQPVSYVPHPQEDNLSAELTKPYTEAYVPPASTTTPVTTQQPASEPTQPATQESQGIFSQPPITEPTSARFPGYTKPPKEETILEWDALSRPFKTRSRQFFTTLITIVILVSLILFFAGQFIPIAVVIAIAFLGYVLSVIPPTMVRHRITTFGLRVEDTLYYWDQIGRFWFTEKYGNPLLHFEVDKFPGRLTLLLGQHTIEEMREIFSEILLEEQPTPTFFDKAATWIENKLPLEAPSNT